MQGEAMRVRILLAALFLIGAGGLLRAEDPPKLDKPAEKPLDRNTIDKRVVDVVYETALIGTEIFNKGQHAECYRLYQGALMGVVPFLDHRAKLQATAKMRLDRAAKMKAADAAFELRTALDEIQAEIAPPKKLTLWQKLGEKVGVERVVTDIVLAAAEDKRVNFFRDGKVKLKGEDIARLKENLIAFISEHTGGPIKYNGKSMAEAHKGMAITDAEFDAFKDVVAGVLKKHNLPAPESEAVLKLIESTRKDIVEKK
jgi:hemoglobin